MNIWSFIQEGRFEEACKIADLEYAKSKDSLLLRNKVYALFHLKKYEEAYILGNRIIERTGGTTDVDFIFSGIALWLMHKQKEAIEQWGNTDETFYKDAGGGLEVQILLFFAGVKLKKLDLKAQALNVLKKLLKSKRGNGWPRPLGMYIVGDLTADELISKVVAIPFLKERQLCQAHFVLAIKELELGNTDGYTKQLLNSINFGTASYIEQFYYLAKGELESLQ